MRAGPKPEVTAEPLDLSALPKSGPSRVVKFIETHLSIPKGAGARGPFKLLPFQREFIGALFPSRGPRPRQALLAIPRGNGKSTLCAALALYGLLGDEVEGAQVICVASDERQARIVWNAARRMVELNPELAARVQVFQDRLYVPATDSTLAPLPSEPGALQGWDPSLCIVDELHVVTEEVWESMALASGKRDRSTIVAISTPAGSRDGIMWKLAEHGRFADDPAFVYREFAAPDGCAVDDEAAWRVANPALGRFLYVDALRATLRTTRETQFRQYRMGQWPLHSESWLPLAAWNACADPRRIPDGASVVLACDGSHRGDVAALVAAQVGEVPHLELLRLWEPPLGAVDFQVPVEQVEDAIAQACQRYSVQSINADPYRWSRVLQRLTERGLPAVEFPQTAVRMSPATMAFAEAVHGGRLTHTGSPDLTKAVMAASVKTGERGLRLAKGTGRIDAAVTAVMAHSVAAEPVFDISQSVW